MRSCMWMGCMRSLHMDVLSTLPSAWESRLLFLRVVLSCVDLCGGGEEPDIYLSNTTTNPHIFSLKNFLKKRVLSVLM